MRSYKRIGFLLLLLCTVNTAFGLPFRVTVPLISTTEQEALGGTSGTPSAENPFVTTEDPRLLGTTLTHTHSGAANSGGGTLQPTRIYVPNRADGTIGAGDTYLSNGDGRLHYENSSSVERILFNTVDVTNVTFAAVAGVSQGFQSALDALKSAVLWTRVAYTDGQTIGLLVHTAVVTTTGSDVGLVLPSAVTKGNGAQLIVKDEGRGAAANPITLTTQGGQTIDGSTNLQITENGGWVVLESNGANWFRIG